MIKYIKGNILEDVENFPNKPIIFPHVCNTDGVMGSGIALGIRNTWPKAEKVYSDVFKRDGELVLGTNQVVKVSDNIYVTNMIAQTSVIDKKPIKYAALVKCMKSIANLFEKDQYKSGQIRTVKFGGLRAGGTWEFIEELIDEIWKDIPVYIYCLEDQI